MSLIVVVSDQQLSESLCRQAEQLGLAVIAADNLSLAEEICGHNHPELLLCADQDWSVSLAARFCDVSVVYLAPELPANDVMLELLRAGIADVWVTPLDNEGFAQRRTEILEGARRARSQAETQLRGHVRELQRDQRAGRYIQMGMLPPNPMAIDNYRLQHRIIPSLILSGDFVDYFQITDRYFAFYIADVSGHGASSAFVTVLLKNFSRRLRREYRPSMIREPGEILEWINRELLEQKIDKHVVLILAVGDLRNNQVTLVNAGHFPPLILVEDGCARFVEQRGKPIGLFESVHYDSITIRIEAGSRLIAFSDGILDALGKASLAEKEKRLLDAACAGSMDAIWKSLGVHQMGAPDDMTCLTVTRER